MKLKTLYTAQGYNSVAHWCRDNKVAPQHFWALYGRKNDPSTVKRMAKRLGVNILDLQSVLRTAYISKVLKDNRVTVEELEHIFITIAEDEQKAARSHRGTTK